MIHFINSTVYLAICNLYLRKAQYGDSAFEHDPGVSSFQLWMRLSDIRRKTTRLNSLTDLAARGDPNALDKLIDDYKDLAIYAIIAVAVLEEGQ